MKQFIQTVLDHLKTLFIYREAPLHIGFGFKTERQDCKLHTAWRVPVEGGRVNGGAEGEGMWLVGFIYIYKVE
jgi:hypothetical protein